MGNIGRHRRMSKRKRKGSKRANYARFHREVEEAARGGSRNGRGSEGAP